MGFPAELPVGKAGKLHLARWGNETGRGTAGEVNNPGAFPFPNGLKVFDYIIAAGGISFETGDRNKIYFVNELGNRKQIAMETDVEPGNLIYIGKTSWTVTKKALTDVLVITGFTGALIALANAVIDLIQGF